MAFVPFDSEGAGGNVSAASISDQFNNMASGLQSMIPGMGPAPTDEPSIEVAGNSIADFDGIRINSITKDMRQAIQSTLSSGGSTSDARRIIIDMGAKLGPG